MTTDNDALRVLISRGKSLGFDARDVAKMANAVPDLLDQIDGLRKEAADARREERMRAEDHARAWRRLAKVEALADEWADFDHDAVTCPKYDCGDCTMVNAIYDLRAALESEQEAGA